MRHLAIVAVSIGWASIAQAQAANRALRGIVEDAQGAPVAGAAITVEGTSVLEVTGDDGAFVVSLPPGEYALTISAGAYAPMVSTAVVDADAPASMRFTLGQITIGNEVISIVNRAPEKTIDVPATVALVRPEELKAAVSYQSALANVMGVDVYTTGVGTSQVSTRGFYKQLNTRMVSMIDGHLAQLPGAGLNMGDWAPASPLDMRFVEVVSGPSSAQYGANAVGGVVDVRTKSPWDESGVAVLARGGTRGLAEGAARIAGTVGDDLGWKVNGQYLQADDWIPDRAAGTHDYGTNVFEGDFVDDYGITQLKLDGAAYYQLGDWQAKASAGYARADGLQLINTGRWQARGSSTLMTVAQLKGPHWSFNAARTGGSAGDSYFVDQAVRVAAAMGGVPADRAAREAIRDRTALHDESQVWSADGQYQRTVSTVALSAGAEARIYQPSSEGTYLADSAGVDLETAEGGAFAQGDARFIGGRLRVVGAARLDVHENYGAQFSPKLVSAFELTPTHVVRAGVSRAYKAPSIVETYLLTSGGVFRGNVDGFEIRDDAGNPVRAIDALQPEVGTALEAGYKGIVRERFFGELVGHYTFYEHFISPLTPVASPMAGTFAFTPDGQRVGDGTLFTYVNFGTARVAGGDVRAAYEGDHVLASASASYLHVMSRDGGAVSDKEITLNVPAVKTVVSLGVKNLATEGWFARVDGRFRSAFAFESGYWSSSTMLPGGELPARFVLDAAAGYEIPRADIAVSVVAKNLLDDDELEVLGAPSPRRMVFLQLELRVDGLRY